MRRLAAIGTLALLALAAACGEEETDVVLGDQCDLDSDCEAPLVCRLTRCRTECATTRDCPIGQLCVTDEGGFGACALPDEGECSLDSDCPEPLVCLGGSCTNECVIDRDCAAGATCESDSAGDRYCSDPAEEPCVLDSDCAPLVCAVDGVCRAECRSDRDCREGTLCVDGSCERPAPPDAGMPDAGTDAGMDAGMDAGPPDAGSDAGPPDAGGTDGGTDGGVDGGPSGCTGPSDCVATDVAVSDCVTGSCEVVECAAGQADCNGLFDDGCEVTLANDPDHCGACDAPCGAYGRCAAGACDAIVDVALGVDHGCFVRENGLVLCSGGNGWGELGRGYFTSMETDPFPARGIDDALSAEGALYSTCAVRPDGVECWGQNDWGELGDGTATRRSLPSDVVGLPDFEQFELGAYASCAVSTAGELWCWGSGDCGENGMGDGVTYPTPQLVTAIPSPEHVATAHRHTCVARQDGTVACWGRNRNGALGDGVADHGTVCEPSSIDMSPVPVDAVGITDAVQVGVGSDTSCALHSDGTVSCWGYNPGGLGAAATATFYDTPQPVVGVTDAVQLVVGDLHACVRLSDDRVQCWGSNSRGELGAGDTAAHDDAVEVVGLTDAVDLALGNGLTCALRATGSPACWGTAGAGELGPDEVGTTLTVPTALPSIRP